VFFLTLKTMKKIIIQEGGRRFGKTAAFKESILRDDVVPNQIKAQIQFETVNKLKPSKVYTS
jgi:hypothetical protein